MKVLVTGHDGYLGRILGPTLRDGGHEVVGLDAGLFAGCTLGPDAHDVPGLHIYTLNRSASAKEIWQNLGLGRD